MNKLRHLWFVLLPILAVIIAVFISGSLSAPSTSEENTAPFTEGQSVSLDGEVVCLQHANTDGPVTLECAYGFKDSGGTYYQLEDKTPDYRHITGVEMGKQLNLEGIYHTSSDTKYQQSGKIEITSLKE